MSTTKIKSPIEHLSTYFAKLRTYYVDFCGGNIRAALVLDYLEYTHAMKIAQYKEAKRYKRSLPTLWQFQSNLNVSIQLGISESEVVKVMKLLKEEGLIQVWNYSENTIQRGERTVGVNPNGKIDTKRWLLFNAEFVQSKINNWALNNLNRLNEEEYYEVVSRNNEDSDIDEIEEEMEIPKYMTINAF